MTVLFALCCAAIFVAWIIGNHRESRCYGSVNLRELEAYDSTKTVKFDKKDFTTIEPEGVE